MARVDAVKFAVERLTPPLILELSDMLARYYEATPASTDIPPYDFDWSMYTSLDAANVLHITTAREHDDFLVGVGLYFVIHNPHHKGLRCAMCDTLAVDHTKRGRGIGGGLLDYTIEKLKERGVQMVVNTYRTCYDTEPLFPKHGFKEWERSFMLRIN